MTIKKYLVRPGYVYSRADKDRHYVTADQLIRLYGVSRDECIIDDGYGEVGLNIRTDLIELAPRYSGDYTLPVK